jgi:hypothetical protein
MLTQIKWIHGDPDMPLPVMGVTYVVSIEVDMRSVAKSDHRRRNTK